MSLNETGYCYIESDKLQYGIIKFKPGGLSIPKIIKLKREIMIIIKRENIKAAFIENYSFGSHSKTLTLLAEVGGNIKTALYSIGIPIYLVSAPALKKFIIAGKAKKELMLKELFRNYGIDTDNNNEADAISLFMFGSLFFDQGFGKIYKRQEESIARYKKEYINKKCFIGKI